MTELPRYYGVLHTNDAEPENIAGGGWWIRWADVSLRLQQLEQEKATLEEREAACCPEDVGFEEWIATLVKQRDQARAALAETRDALQQLQKEYEDVLARGHTKGEPPSSRTAGEDAGTQNDSAEGR